MMTNRVLTFFIASESSCSRVVYLSVSEGSFGRDSVLSQVNVSNEYKLA